MTESKFTAKLLVALRVRMPSAVMLKHSDRFTSGVPDFSVTRNGVTTWCEVKVTTNPHIFEPLQFEICRRMWAYYLIWSPSTKRGYIFRANGHDKYKLWTQHEPRTFEEIVEFIVRTF